MKKTICMLLAVILALALCGCGAAPASGNKTQEPGEAASAVTDETKLGDYNVEIKSCRLAKDYEGKPVAIITFGFTNNGKEDAAFYTSLSEKAYQNGVEINSAYILDDSANYVSDNATKSIKPGVTLDVEQAYELNDNTTDILVEVSEFISFNDTKISKTFTIAS